MLNKLILNNTTMKNNFIQNFLVNSEETGRHIVVSFRTGRKYFIEPIGYDRMADWGSYNPSSGKIENKKGAGKYTGSVLPEESMIKPENGFTNIHFIESGSPYSIIDKMDSLYPSI
ncbi:hypothetical protein GCM10027035_46490 [Emticicia sediminis]